MIVYLGSRVIDIGLIRKQARWSFARLRDAEIYACFHGLSMSDFVLSTGHDLIDQLRAYRLKVALTQDDIAWKLGFSPTTVSRWERGVAVPDLRATGAIVDFLRRADAQTERRLLKAILNAHDSRNLWEGRDIRYLGGSQQEYRESPEMRAVVGTSIRRYHHRLIPRLPGRPRALVASLYAREIASIQIYGGTALSVDVDPGRPCADEAALLPVGDARHHPRRYPFGAHPRHGSPDGVCRHRAQLGRAVAPTVTPPGASALAAARPIR
jgi:transcriptional regulator with XRE-family HTH domain